MRGIVLNRANYRVQICVVRIVERARQLGMLSFLTWRLVAPRLNDGGSAALRPPWSACID